MRRLYISLFYFNFFLCSIAIHGQLQVLNPNFGSNGRVLIKLGDSRDIPSAVAVNNDGNIIVAGTTSLEPNNTDITLIKYNAGGSVDNSFGIKGKVLTDMNNGYDNRADNMKIQNDGKIIVIGSASSESTSGIMLVRYNSDGTLDNSFNTNGVIIARFSDASQYEYGIALDIQSDNKIVVCANNAGQIIVARYNSNGSLDNSFGASGKVIFRAEPYYTTCRDLKILSSGKIVVAAETEVDSRYQLCTFVLNNDGTFDNSFSSDGLAVSSFPNNISCRSTTVWESNSKIIVSGNYQSTDLPQTKGVAIIRYNLDGSSDSSFDSDGMLISNLTLGIVDVRKVFVQSDGKLVVAGTALSGGIGFNRIVVARFNVNGSMDLSFGTNGVVSFANFSVWFEFPIGLFVQSDEKILVSTSANNSRGSDDFLLVRINSNGNFDNSFGANGSILTNISDGYDFAYSIKAHSDGKVVVGGTTYLNDNKFVIARFNSNGSQDLGFGNSGSIMTGIDINSNSYTTSIQIQDDGKIIAGGVSKATATSFDFSLARFNTNGSIDATFGSSGFQTTDADNKENYLNEIKLQSDNKIVAVGSSYLSAELSGVLLARYNSNGSLDNSFGVNGVVKFNVPTYDCYGTSIALQSNGKILITGNSLKDGKSFVLIARFNVDGSLDNSFSDDGYNFYSWNEMTANIGKSIKVQSDGKILVTGFSTSDTEVRGFIVRINEDGSLDNSFNGTGLVSVTAGGMVYLNSLDIHSNGKIIAGGTYYESSADSKGDFIVIRLKSDGTLDNTFNITGIVISDIGADTHDVGIAVLASSDNSIYLTGNTQNDFDSDGTVVKYEPDGSVSSVASISNIPGNFQLLQNYPNPFNPKTTISYSLNFADKVTLKIYDLLGNEISTLVNGIQNAGIHYIDFDAESISSGIYFYSLEAAGYKEVKKMILLK